ncbi:MAG: WXG100 family type VII secretion target [Candidatus Promineifilaceae bacterium]
MDIIQVDYEMLEQVSAKFVQQCEAAQQMAQDITNRMQALEGEWIGEGSVAFFAEMSDLMVPSMQRLVDSLSEAGEATNRIAQVYANAEEEASNSFSVIA